MRKLSICLFVAGATAGYAATANAQTGRNCPVAVDQTVLVGPGPIEFTLNIQNYTANDIVSIFQYPLGGILEQGPTPVDFVFVPMTDFRGTTTFTYRLQTSSGCGSLSVLKTVTLARGTAESTASGVVPPPQPTLCGIPVASMTLMPLLLMFMKHHYRTPTHRKKSQLL